MKGYNFSSFIETNIFNPNSSSLNSKRTTNEKGHPRQPNDSIKRLKSTAYPLVSTPYTISGRDESSLTRFKVSPSRLSHGVDIILCSIFELTSTLSTKIGMCVINFATGELFLTEYIDSQIFIRTVNKMHMHEPTDILLPNTSFTPITSKLATILKFNTDDETKISETAAKEFNDDLGIELLRKYCLKGSMTSKELDRMVEKTFALAAVSAAICYIEEVVYKNVRLGNSTFKHFRIKYEDSESTMLIDSKTIRGLELTENKFKKDGLSFFKYMDQTSTKMGQRLLRNNILQPLTDKGSLIMRLDAVYNLVNNKDNLFGIVKELKKCEDLDRLFSKLLSFSHTAVHPKQKINFILLLKESISVIKRVTLLLDIKEINSKLLEEVKRILKDKIPSEIEELIERNINIDCQWATSPLQLQQQQTYAVKSDVSPILCVSRTLYENLINELQRNVRELNKAHNLAFEYSYEERRGFFLKQKRNIDSTGDTLPDIFINKSIKKNYIECSTMDILKINVRLQQVRTEILLSSELIIDQLLDDIMNKRLSSLFMISEAVSILDMLCCFAQKALGGNYCKPKYSNIMCIKDSRHPVLDSLIDHFVPNDIMSMPQSSSFHLITGCNMSGKSVYLRQISLLCIMAQIGCPVPATSASFPIYNRLHARVCNDSMEVNSSNFSFEMKEMAYFLDSLKDNTLFILDELGRGSSIGDGLAISLAISEYLLNFDCTVFMSTHFREIPELLKYKSRVVHLDMKTDITSDNQISRYYRLSSDCDVISNSGIRVVSSIFDKNIILQAFEIASKLERTKHKNNPDSFRVNADLTNDIKKINNIISILDNLALGGENEMLHRDLKGIQTKFINNFSDNQNNISLLD